MANYNCAIRTNYFRVKDGSKFKKLMESVCAEDRVDVWEELRGDGWYYGFGCYGSIYGVMETSDIEEDDDASYGKFIDDLMEVVADDDAIVIFEAGNEKLRYVVGSVEVITSKNYTYCSMEDYALSIARNMLQDQDWQTKCTY